MDEQIPKIVIDKLERMAVWAESRRIHMEENLDHYGKEGRYTRIGGNGYRAISIAEKTPMQGFYEPGSTVKTMQKIDVHFNKGKVHVAQRSKPEASLQAWIIRHALQHNLSLKKLLQGGGLDQFDDILFALDEVSLGDSNHKIPLNDNSEVVMRCDILAVGIYNGNRKGHPILIELKWKRALKELFRQLDDFSNLISSELLASPFETLLGACVGIDVDCSKVYKCLIWPPATGGQSSETDKRLKEHSDISVFEYNINYDFSAS